MKIEVKKIKISDLVNGYVDNKDESVGLVGFGGKLDIRPPYQREFVYDDKQRDAVIDTVLNCYPLNLMYWVENKNTGQYELLDGQQRTLSISRYWDNRFSIEVNGNPKQFNTLTKEEQERFLGYDLLVGFCTEATDAEKLKWFERINTAGEKLTNQELLNAVYHGPWVTEAKKYFSKTGGAAYMLGNKYINKGLIPKRQEYLEIALKWIVIKKRDELNDKKYSIKGYMNENRDKKNANELREYYDAVISWVKARFPEYRKEMQGLEWGRLYHQYKDKPWDWAPDELEARIKELVEDEEVQKKSGIYEFLLSGENRKMRNLLNLRHFSDKQKQEVYEKQNGICIAPDGCGKKFEYSEMEGDHIKAWSKGGKTELDNLQMLCLNCNRTKSDK